MKKGALFTSIGSIIILIICFIAFVLPSSMGKSQQDSEGIVFGKYGNKTINYGYQSDFANYVSSYAEMYRSQGYQIDNSMQYYLFQNAFNSTVVKYAYDYEVKKSGYVIPQEAVNRKLRPYFYDENGKFSAKLFNSADQSQIQSLQKDIKEDLAFNRYSDDVFGTSASGYLGNDSLYGIKNSNAELNFLNNFDAEKRAFNMIAFKKSDYPEEEKIAFAKKNAAKFNNFDLAVITVEDKATATKVANRLAKEEITFEDAITEYSDKNYSNTEGKLNNSFQYQLENILEDKAEIDTLSKLAVGSISDVIKTKIGYSIFKSNAAVAAPDFEADSIKSRVSTYITSYESSIIEDYYTAKANDFATAAANMTFDDACLSNGYTNISVPAFALNYNNTTICESIDSTITELAGADSNENFLKSAFSLKLNEISKPIVLNDYIVVLQYIGEGTKEPELDAEGNPVEEDSLETQLKSVAYVITNYDEEAAEAAIMSSPLLKNNFAEAYYSNLMQ